MDLIPTGVRVISIDGQQVDVVDNDAVPGTLRSIGQGLEKANVQEGASVEQAWIRFRLQRGRQEGFKSKATSSCQFELYACLRYDVYFVGHMSLCLEKGMKIAQEDLQVLAAISEGHQNGRPRVNLSPAPGGAVKASTIEMSEEV